MNPVNATSLYLSACRSVLQCDAGDPETYAELYRVLPFFRDSLSCLVCGNLLQDPIAPNTCQHYVCKACKGKKMTIKPACSWCKDYDQFTENKQLGILVECYRKLCEYISESPLVEQIASTAGGSPEIMFMLEDVLGMKLEQESPGVLDIPSLMLPLSSAASEGLPPTSHLAEQAASSLDAEGAVKEEPLDHAIQDNYAKAATAGAVVEVSSSVLPVSMDVVTVQESPVPREPSSGTFNSFSDSKHSHEPVLFSVDEALESLESGCLDEDLHDGLQRDLLMSVGLASGLSEPRTSSQQDSRTLTSSHSQKPPSGISCSAATPRTARLHRKRSHSESDSEKVKPLPIASFIEEPPVASPAPLTVTHEPNDTVQPFAKIPSDRVLQVNKALLDTTKNIQQNLGQSVKNICTTKTTKTNRPKDKTKDRPLSGSVTSGNSTKVYKKAKEKKGCKCGRATQNPSVLTCRGQRCPCYSTRKACLDCICRGCQNSYMANGEKKLEAFAVPEKALEQTRLTLGINYTSIAVRNVGANAGVLSLSADSPITSFLVASSHDGSQHRKKI
ncbi:E3 ubiquitin-protein ligase MSL2a [Alosa pseudoharengus]|uniref:E3 ubiquitin-protein ligase MSL2a n=1 Tax=Alosa pseudoharengus TaxID=34774 RepID=UPI003F895D0E